MGRTWISGFLLLGISAVLLLTSVGWIAWGVRTARASIHQESEAVVVVEEHDLSYQLVPPSRWGFEYSRGGSWAKHGLVSCTNRYKICFFEVVEVQQTKLRRKDRTEK